MASEPNRDRLGQRDTERELSHMPLKVSTSQQILDVAQDLVQTRGFNAFSYGDIAKALKVTNASLHYHFPSKADLGNSLISRYEERFLQALDAIDAGGGTMIVRFRAFINVYADVLSTNHMCLCGMLAAEFETLPQTMQSALDHYFEAVEAWLETVLEQGRQEGQFSFDDPAREVAQFAIATLEGAMILARSHNDHDRFRMAGKRLLAGLTRPDLDLG